MNGRELTARDVEYNFHRLLGWAAALANLRPIRFCQFALGLGYGQDDGTVVFKLKQLNIDALPKLLSHWVTGTIKEPAT